MIECSWDTFAKQLVQATSLDDIIAAHNHFVDSVRHGTLLDEKSQVRTGLCVGRHCIMCMTHVIFTLVISQKLMDHLRSVYYPIQDLQNHEETFLTRATQEYEARLKTDDFVQPKKKSDRTNKKDQEAVERETAFSKYLNTFSRQLKLLSRTYQVVMK